MAPDDRYDPSPLDYLVRGIDHARVSMVVACLFLAADTGFSLRLTALKGIALGLLGIGEYIKLREEGVDERIRGDELIRLDEPKDLYKEVDRRLKE
ncbi:MAG: hypothetical protein HY529_04765, partial [Chloroflexi bacterium]|nr:hypothetical protein [Chloroflexota bacterium]